MTWLLFIGGVLFLGEGLAQGIAFDLWRAGVSLALGAVLLDTAWRRARL